MKIITFVVLLCLGMFASPLMASDYIGQYCFRAVSSDATTRLMKLGVSDMGGNHYQIAGTWNWEDGSGRAAPINGNIAKIGDNLEGALNFTFYADGFLYTRFCHLELDPTSLEGDLRMIKVKREKATGNTSHGGSSMPVSLVPCP